MRINKGDTLAGQPIVLVRNFLRHVELGEWTVEFVAHWFSVDKYDALLIANTLEAEGYAKKHNHNEQSWISTLKGNSLAMATAANPISRKTAEKVLSQFLDRVKEVNGNDEYLYRVKKVIVFGSYLSDKPKINDIDIAVELAPKNKVDRQWDLEQKKISKAIKEGRNFSNIAKKVQWPKTEVYLFLKSRHNYISLHCADDKILEQADHCVVYDNR